jgi:outer membrane murein-binding lipoprotein Lpp
MFARSTFKVVALCAVVLSLVVSVVGVQTQRRRRPSRRATNPVSPTYVPAPTPTATPDPSEPRLISSAEDQAQQDDARPTPRRTPTRPADAKDTESRKEVDQLSTQLRQLNKKVDAMEQQRRTDLIQERLTRAEQRVESLQTQMSEVMEKEANLQSRVDQIDEQMRPENLDRQLATTGTFRPDEARDSLRRQLDNEKRRVRSQLDVQAARRQQLESSLVTAQQLAERLRTDLNDAMRREAEGEDGTTVARPTTPTTNTRPPAPNPTPAATPPPM